MKNKTISPAPSGCEALIISELQAKEVIYITNNDKEMAEAKSALEFFCPEYEILEFPAWDIMPYDRCSPNSEILSKRVSALSKLANQNVSREALVILTTINAISQKIPAKENFKNNSLFVQSGQNMSRNDIIKFLAKNNYDRVSKVMEQGEFAVRGDIIDIFTTNSEDPIRLDFFGDNIESIKSFDAIAQTSIEPLEKLEILPASEIVLSPKRIEIFKKNFRNNFGLNAKDGGLYESITSNQRFPGFENWLPLFYDGLATIFDYVSRETLLFFAKETFANFDIRKELIEDYYNSRKIDSDDYVPVEPVEFYLKNLNPLELGSIELSDFDNDNNQDSGFRKTIAIGKDLEKLAPINKKILISCSSKGSMLHIQNLLKSKQIKSKELSCWKDAKKLKSQEIGLFSSLLESGFENSKFMIIAEKEIFGNKLSSGSKRRKTGVFEDVGALEIGEIIVHEEHGIGKFAGLEILEVDNTRHDMLKLLFAGDDRLFVPVENIDLITKYGSSNGDTRLDKLGGAAWQERNARLKEKIKYAAEQLLRIAAERALIKTEPINPNTSLYNEFCDDFPHSETDDQLNAIDDILSDLKSGQIMDRLVCGDVGFGKTEVAMRAAFAVAESGKQVALICPTTLLARQHYNNFVERFKNHPFEIGQVSRIVNANVSRETFQKTKSGDIDILIGTHALLNENLKFKDLGLLIIDEEQHFGVRQKEKLKELKSNAHLISLSATPIPRSLQMAVSGIKELSLIATPPVDRLAVRSFVSMFDEITIREAISREMNRNGQVFYVAPRLSDLEEIENTIRKLTPKAKYAIAHGKMKPQELDEVMTKFYEGEVDILVSTTIVESGLDVKNANTLIIHRADMFGLAQLYQLRGRVGRGKQRGYAYFTLPKNKIFTKNAYKRLEVIKNINSLGAGFSIASHDMDIRGFGNLLGEEQSGHIKEVGIELYQKMLQEAVNRAKAEEGAVKDSFTVNINLGLSILIPENYIEDLEMRMELYKRAANLASIEEADKFMIELTDRFGRPPIEVIHYLEIMKLKILCKDIGICKIDSGPKAVIIQFIEKPYISNENILGFVAQNSGRVKIKPNNKLVLENIYSNSQERLNAIYIDLLNLHAFTREIDIAA